MQEKTIAPITNQTVTGILYALSGSALFSLKPVVVKLAYQYSQFDIDAITLLTLRMLFSLPFYLVITWYFLQQSKPENSAISLRTIAGIGLTGFLGYYLAAYLDIWGLQYITAQLERMTLFIYPTIIVILSAVFLKMPVKRNMLLALLMSYSGIAIMYYQENLLDGENTPKGMLLVTLSALSFALYMLLSKQFIQKLGSPLFTGLAMLASSAFIICHFLITQDMMQLNLEFEVYIIILIIAIPCTVIPSYLISAAIARIGSAKTSIVHSSGPIITVFAAVAILGEPFSMVYVLGMGLIMYGVFLLSKRA